MSAYFIVIDAEDGEHVSRYPSYPAMLKELSEQLDRDTNILAEMPINRMRFTDDWGRRIRVEKATMSTADRRKYRDAFDARECGVLTAAQRRLLARIEG